MTRAHEGEGAYHHLVLLARDREGYRNLDKVSTFGYTEGFYGRPRVDREVLAKHAVKLIVTSSCMAGEVARHLEVDDWDGARETAAWYAELYRDRYCLEVQEHSAHRAANVVAPFRPRTVPTR